MPESPISNSSRGKLCSSYGKLPSRVLTETPRPLSLVHRPISEGMVPTNEFESILKSSKLEARPISVGIVPISSLKLSPITHIDGMLKSSVGIDPCKKLPSRSIVSRLDIVAISVGIVPSILFSKAPKKVRSVKSTSSVGMAPFNLFFCKSMPTMWLVPLVQLIPYQSHTLCLESHFPFRNQVLPCMAKKKVVRTNRFTVIGSSYTSFPSAKLYMAMLAGWQAL
mmetsp:Transcript_10887/g.18413  ORF Transcript_10887/g.18413 Transcript_10887/m.18413 type:complete len:224 (+) Transcript_10887:596-1267(+)